MSDHAKPNQQPKPIIRADERGAEFAVSHPLNPNSQVYGHPLSMMSGLKRTGVNWIRLPPGKESFAYHRHHGEEEWSYILSGRGEVELDEVRHPVGAGDFIAYPAGTAHHMYNNSGEDLVYLSGGEHHDREIADFPRHGKRMVRDGSRIAIYPLDAGEAFPGFEKL